jgi:hypothetical protein
MIARYIRRWASAGPGVPILVFAVSFTFYLVNLAPSTLWGDDAKFQLFGYELSLTADELGHPLYVLVAHIFSLLPIGAIAWRVNLASAAQASLTLVFVFLSARALTSRTAASLASTLSFSMSHTFWSFAERPQAQALNSLFMAALVFGALTWRGSLKQYFFWCYIFGLGLTNHFLLAFVLPGIAWLFYAGARRFKIKRAWLFMGVLPAAIGFLPYFLLAIAQGDVGRSLSVVSLAQQFLAIQTPLRDAALWIAFLTYNFVGAAVLLIVFGAVRLWRGQRATLGGILMMYLISVWFVFDSQLPDQYKYYIPSYLALALLVGPGYLELDQWLWRRVDLSRVTAVLLLLPLLILIPILTYHIAPQMLHSAGVSTLLDVRNLPYRDALDYYLQPSRREDYGAARFAQEALALAAPDAVLAGDHTPLAPIRFTQITEGIRPDVTLFELPSSDQAAVLKDLARNRTVYLLDAQKYYDMGPIGQFFVVVPVGVLYKLTPQTPSNP